ncbi:MAG: hypothetical protein M1827_003415 [Pycnora praestabilis]|nr:MAG: hypothetical protein M1827_003415 [Pycnora praestabilis]
MPFFNTPMSFRNANVASVINASSDSSYAHSPFSILRKNRAPPHSSHPSFDHLILLVFEAVLEVVCVALPGYIVARQGMFNADMQKFVANLNVTLFTPCLIFTKLASQLTADKLGELAVIPVIFAVQTLVSYLCAVGISKAFGFKKRPRNFVVAMGVFGNSNSLPISLVISLAQTLKGLHWDKLPGDNDDEVAARGILYLLVFQQLGQLVRWSWGYHILLAPPSKVLGEAEHTNSQIEQGQDRYRDDPEADDDPDLLVQFSSEVEALQGGRPDNGHRTVPANSNMTGSQSGSDFESGGQTPVTRDQYASSLSSKTSGKDHAAAVGPPDLLCTPANGNVLPSNGLNGHITSFPSIRSATPRTEDDIPEGPRGWVPRIGMHINRALTSIKHTVGTNLDNVYDSLPSPIRRGISKVKSGILRFCNGLWAFMNPPLWAMLIAIIVASIPALQKLFFNEGSFLRNSVTRAIGQSGGVAVPLILVVLGANLARNTLPQEQREIADEKEDRKLLIASLVSRMLLPTIIMAPLLALAAKFVPVSILDDPIFVIVCFLLTGAPSALQLAQICQINGVYEGVMSKLLFQSYVIWILPSTLVLVMCALEVVEWANDL